MIDFLNRVFKGNRKSEYTRFNYPLFKDASIQAQIKRNGYAKLPLLTNHEVQQLKSDFYTLLELLHEELPDRHWSSGRVEDVMIRNFARDAIHKIVPQRLENYFDPAATDFVGGIFVAKKPSDTSELTCHQDSSHVDERKYCSVYAWIPLVDTDIHNGALHVLPGSHLWGNRFRSLNVPWLYAGFENEMMPYIKPIPMKAGEVLFFDSAAIHYSTNNMSNEIRPAINFFVKPRQALFLHHFTDEKTPLGKVETFNVDIDFFYNCDFMKRPPAPYQFLGYENAIFLKKEKGIVSQLCKKYFSA